MRSSTRFGPPVLMSAMSVVVVAVISEPVLVHSQGELMCVATQYLANKDRNVDGPVNAECSGSLHNPPWGNWGVDSNWNSRLDADQFMGWKDTGGHHEWNSCTSEYLPGNCAYYNANFCGTQSTNRGIGFHAVMQGAIGYGSCE